MKKNEKTIVVIIGALVLVAILALAIVLVNDSQKISVLTAENRAQAAAQQANSVQAQAASDPNFINTQTACFNNARANYAIDAANSGQLEYGAGNVSVNAPRFAFSLTPSKCAFEFNYSISENNYQEVAYIINDGNSNDLLASWSDASNGPGTQPIIKVMISDESGEVGCNSLFGEGTCTLAQFEAVESSLFPSQSMTPSGGSMIP